MLLYAGTEMMMMDAVDEGRGYMCGEGECVEDTEVRAPSTGAHVDVELRDGSLSTENLATEVSAVLACCGAHDTHCCEPTQCEQPRVGSWTCSSTAYEITNEITTRCK